MARTIFFVALLGVLLGACGNQGAAQPTTVPQATTAPQPTKVILAMPYIPNVQFAHYYVAQKNGYYAQEGIDLTFDYNYETDVVQRVAQNTVQFGLSSADSVLLARAQGLPVRMIATNSQRFPTVFYSKVEQNITTPEDLKGKSVGIPGRFGASYIGLLALLYATKIPESDLNIQEIGFAQVAALSEDKVQVASGYGNNEPIQLESQGVKLNIIKVSDYYPLASDGMITSEKLLTDNPALVRGFVRATLRGMQDVISNPDAAFTTALEYIPEAQRGDQALQKQVLVATIPFWQSDKTVQQGLGYTDPESWKATHQFLRDAGILKTDVKIEDAFTNEYRN